MNFSIDYNEVGIQSAEMILYQLDKNISYHDSLDIHFSKAVGYCTPILRNVGYESLKSYGPNILVNDSLLRKLDIYNVGFIETLILRQENYFYNTASPILVELFETVAMRTDMKPLDYEELKKNQENIAPFLIHVLPLKKIKLNGANCGSKE
ncbi:MAG: hypothetical protein ACJA01_001199 [Saprospiraceae bacterium]